MGKLFSLWSSGDAISVSRPRQCFMCRRTSIVRGPRLLYGLLKDERDRENLTVLSCGCFSDFRDSGRLG